jgi:hypothetical protein
MWVPILDAPFAARVGFTIARLDSHRRRNRNPTNPVSKHLALTQNRSSHIFFFLYRFGSKSEGFDLKRTGEGLVLLACVTLEQAIRRVQQLSGPVIYSIGLLFGDEMSHGEVRD